MPDLSTLLLSSLLSGAVMSAVVGMLMSRRTESIKREVESQFARHQDILRSRRTWQEKSLADLLGPVFIQLDRTKRAFDRWDTKNLYLEAKVVREGNIAIRDLLLRYPHLIPPELLEDAAQLIQHYDRWLEEYERTREALNPDLETPFVFVGTQGCPFPTKADARFRETFRTLWHQLYGETPSSTAPRAILPA